MTMLRKIQAFLKLLQTFAIFPNTKSLKDMLFRKANLFVAEMNLLKNSELMCDEEIFSFIRIYLLYKPAKNNYVKSDFLFDGRLPLNRICWMGPYLQKKGDYKYW